LERDIEELEKTKPLEPPPAQTKKETEPPPSQVPPEVQDFFDANPWYGFAGNANPDLELTAFADGVHSSITRTRPGLSPKQALDYVTEQTKKAFPAKFGVRVNGNGRQQSDDEHDDDSPAVLPSSGGTPRPRANRFTFDSMPKESKDAYVRYAKMLEGKGDPLKKEEWAETYWAQFRDDGA
jgi:hypothetical protein